METLRVGDLILDPNSGHVQVGRKSAQLTPTESDLLKFLMTGCPRLYSARQLLFQFWPMPPKGGTSIVRVYVQRVRRKIEDDPAHPTRLVTIWGFGYRIVAVARPIAVTLND